MWGTGNLGGTSLLNFKIIGGTNKPNNERENTIWVNTDIPITEWIFSVGVPDNPVEGMVWFLTGTASPIAFNALKKNSVMVYPSSAKQYVSGAWVNQPVQICRNGAWVAWDMERHFIRSGILEEPLDGKLRTGQTVTVTQSSGYVYFDGTGAISGGNAPIDPVDVTNYKNLTLYVDVVDKGDTDSDGVGVVLMSALNATSYSAMMSNIIARNLTTATGVQTLVCDISTVSGLYYPGIFVDAGNAGTPRLKVYDFYLS